MNTHFEKRIKWYEEAPLCEECNQVKTLVGYAKVGFFGLCVGHFRKCLYCLPKSVARKAIEIRNSLLLK